MDDSPRNVERPFPRKWQEPWLRNDILAMAAQLCKSINARLLYLVFFGSALYGTDTATSDIDVKGIFAPHVDRLLLGDNTNSIHSTTGDSSRRNSPEDVDMELWSLGHWLLNLLKKGDTGAVDLLFSFTHQDCILYKAPGMDWIFRNTNRLLNSTLTEVACGYALHQAKKYGIKGSRLGLFRKISQWLEAHQSISPSARLSEIMPELIDTFGNEPFFSYGCTYIVTGGKTHISTIRIAEFAKRIELEKAKYGDRADAALRNDGVDFKALSHALRATGQIEELFKTGSINYPLTFAQNLLSVKQAKLPWTEVEAMILAAIERMEKFQAKHTPLHWDQKFAEACVLRLYRGETFTD